MQKKLNSGGLYSRNQTLKRMSTNIDFKGFSYSKPDREYSYIVFSGENKYISHKMARTSPGADSILDMLKNNTTRIEHEDGFSLQNTSNMNFFRFHKMKSQIEYIRNCLNRLSDIPYTSFIPKVNEIIGASGMSKDEIFDKLLMLPESAEAIIVLFDYSLTLIQVNDYKSDMISYHKVNLKKTIHAKAIFEHLIEYISDGAGLTRGAIKQCWDMMTNDEKLSVQQQIKDKIG